MRELKLYLPSIGTALVLGTLLAAAGCSSSNGPVVAPSTVTLTASSTSINIPAPVTLTATLSTGTGTPTPIGGIDFYDGSSFIAPALVDGHSTVSITAALTTPGAHVISASYYGDQTHAASAPATATINVYDPTTITLVASPAAPAFGSPVTLTATITGLNGFNPTGAVTFYNGATAIGNAPLGLVTVGGGTSDIATLTTTALPVGNNSITAVFGAANNFLTSTSAATIVQVHGVLVLTTTVVTTPLPTTPSGTITALTATVTPASPGPAPLTGSITFFDGANNLGTATIANGTATLSTKQFVSGANAITGVYSGDVFFAGSTSPASTLTVTAYTGATYTNPLNVTDPLTGKVYNCPDPAVIKSQSGSVDTWYAYCTGDAFNVADTLTPGGTFRPHQISVFSSSDLVNWTFVHDAFTTTPTWVQAGQELQTPAIKFFGGLYHLYYEAPASAAKPNGSAIGVGTSTTAAGPFTDSGTPVIPQSLACGGGCNRTTFSPEVIADASGQLWITYGGVFAGLSIRKLSADGLTSDPTTEINIAVDNYYQDPFLWYHGGYFYEFVTAGGCCGGPLSSDNVHVGRSLSITGPYDDAEGNDVNAYSTKASVGAPGGDPVLMQNGNDIVGAGSNTVITDESGQDYIVYSGVSRKQPYLPSATGYTARQLMIDPLDWVNGWPKTRNGAGPSDFSIPQPVPAAQPLATNGYVMPNTAPDSPGTLIAASSDEFNSNSLSPQWSFVHGTPAYSLTGSAYNIPTVNADSGNSSFANLPFLAEPEPAGNYLLETKFSFTVPATGYIFFLYPQAGVFIYNSDSSFLRLDEEPNFEVRNVLFIDQIVPPPGSGYPTSGAAPVGPPNFGGSTYFRIAKRVGSGGAPDVYTSYISTDGITYLKGPAWTASYGTSAKIGLYSGNTAGYVASFDYIRVSTLLP